MKKIIAFMLILALSLSLVIFATSCKSCNDNGTTDLPGGVENPGSGFGDGDGDDNNDGSGDGLDSGWLPIG